MSYIVSEKTKTTLQKLLTIPEVAAGFDFIKQDQNDCIAEPNDSP